MDRVRLPRAVLVAMAALFLVPSCGSGRTSAEPSRERTSPPARQAVTSTPTPGLQTTDPELVANARACASPDEATLQAVQTHVGAGYRLTRPAVMVIAAVGTDETTGEASRYTYLAAEVREGRSLRGPAVWAAVNVYDVDGWMAVDTNAKQISDSEWPTADGTDAAVQRNEDDYSRVVACTAEGGFPGGPTFSVPPDGG